MLPAIACTIVANNYLPFARTFARSFLEHHPEGEVWVCLVDEPSPDIDYEGEPFRLLLARELGIPAFENFAFRYSILELNTAVKPYFLARLHEREGYPAACYFDPDILVLGDLHPVYSALESADVALTPHVLAPLDDTKIPSERDFLLSGIYNLGFLGIAFNADTLPFLQWWQSRLYRYCEHRVERGLFVDQRWMDFAPAFLPRPRILRDPGLNVAYWNLVHRQLVRRGGEYRVNGEPLRFFHFSGFRPERPKMVSKYQDRIRFEDRPDIQPIFRHYAELLHRNGLKAMASHPYAYGRFENGAKIPTVAREALRVVDPRGERWADPFSTRGGETFFDWLRAPARLRDDLTLPRIALVMWDLRADLQQTFPQPQQLDAQRFANWFLNEVATSPDLDAGFATSLRKRDHLGSGLAVPDPQVRAALPSSLFESDGRRVRVALEDARWLNAEASYDPASRPRVTRLAMILHRHRADLVASYPEPLGNNRTEFALWFVTSGRLEYALPARLVRPVLRTMPWRRRLYVTAWWLRNGIVRRTLHRLVSPLQRSDGRSTGATDVVSRHEVAPPTEPQNVAPTRSGINVVGWATARTGVGEACRATLSALDRCGVPRALWSLRHPTLEGDGDIFGRAKPELPYRTTLFHVNADMMPLVTTGLPLKICSDQHRIGYWFWELSHFPLHLANSFRYVDEVWAPTRFCQHAYEVLSPVPVRWVPPPVQPVEAVKARRGELDLPDGSFVFFFAFDALSVPERKNPFALIRAFEIVASRADKPVHLLLKMSHGDDQPELLKSLQRRSSDLPVTMISRSVPRRELDSMMASCDAYVSLHRSEGLGLPLIEAMMQGKPVIATGYGGCTDFLDESSGWPISYRLVTLDRTYGPYPEGAVWADPSVEHAAHQMLEVLRHPQAAAERSSAARRRIDELYSLDAAGARFRDQLKRIEAMPREAECNPPPVAAVLAKDSG